MSTTESLVSLASDLEVQKEVLNIASIAWETALHMVMVLHKPFLEKFWELPTNEEIRRVKNKGESS